MRTDPLNRFAQLQQQLGSEKKAIELRLERINQVLGGTAEVTAAPVPAKKSRAPRRRNKLSLRAAMVAAMKGRALTKEEIYKAITDAGYKFSGKQPMNSINVQLYTKGQFKRDGKKFAPTPAVLKAVGS